MNLKQMREYVSNILDYNPDVQQYKNEVTNILNQVYITHFTERPWEYAQREYDIEIYKDRTLTGETWARGVFVNPQPSGNDNAIYGPFMVFEPTTDVGNLVANKEYKILSRFDVVSNAYVNIQDPVYPLDQYPVSEAVITNFSTGDSVDFKLKHRHITLPHDCIEVLGVGLRGRQSGFRQPFFNLAKYEDEKMGLDLDQVGIPTNWIETQPLSIPAPRITPTIATQAGTNLTQTAGTYQCAYTFTVLAATTRGITEIESAPIFGVEQTFAAGVCLGVTNIEETENYIANIPQSTFRELRKHVYIKTPETKHFVRVTDQATVAPQQTDTTSLFANGIDFSQPLLFESKPKLLENEGNYKTFRLYPRQDDDYTCKLRYHYRPKELRDDQDTPKMPADAHLYICYAAIAEIFYKHSNIGQGNLYEQKARKELLKIENKYLTQKDKAHIKGGYRASDSYYGRPFVRITRVP